MIASSIAAAVEQQGVATAEIARNVTETASAANQMMERTNEVSAEASDTGRHAADVRENVTGLNDAMEELRHSVIRVVRTSTTEVDRRACRRHAVDLPCQVTVGGERYHGRVADLSDNGAQLRGIPVLEIGARGTLEIETIAGPLPFAVRSHEDDMLHLVFVLDEATASAFSGTAERLAERRAA